CDDRSEQHVDGECDGNLDGFAHADAGTGDTECDCGSDVHIRRIRDGKRNRDVIADDYSDA
ncbi:MAG: hypothetical protein KGR25_02555, partial [Chloroflexi bacterium]|nr:hypothetical protein [Chloroflexota bacterium]